MRARSVRRYSTFNAVQRDTRKSVFRSERGSESKAIQNQTISGARVFLATKVLVTQIWERGCFLAPRFFFAKIIIF